MIFIIFHVLCLYGTSGGQLFELNTKYELVHTHAHDHHHEHVEDFNDHDLQTSGEHGRIPHKHEIVVATQIQYVQSNGVTIIIHDSGSPKYCLFRVNPPLPPYLNAIFRPPILV